MICTQILSFVVSVMSRDMPISVPGYASTLSTLVCPYAEHNTQESSHRSCKLCT